MRSIAHAPEGLQRYQALGHYARYDTDLSEAQKELVVCATVSNVSYGWEHHAPLAKQCGVTDGQLALLKDGEIPPDLPPSDQALCRFTFEFSSFKGVRQETATELLRHFTERQIVDMALISAFYLGRRPDHRFRRRARGSGGTAPRAGLAAPKAAWGLDEVRNVRVGDDARESGREGAQRAAV